jgi:3-methyladenine DNA glycosylase AlkC
VCHLKDDAELHVRRSVANNLNDIGNDHPDLLLGKSVSLKQMTMRMHHPGRHAVHALVNGVTHCIGHFDVVA